MRFITSTALIGLTCTLLVGGAMADTVTETFDGNNPAGWTLGNGADTIQEDGGNPGGFLFNDQLDTFAPQPRSGWGIPSEWTGNYRQKGVTSLGVDFKLFHVDFSAGDRPLTVMLHFDGGTPDDFDDDYAAYIVGPENVPLVGEGWKSYDFEIPSQETSLPAGWKYLEFGPNSNPDWNEVIENVSQVVFFWGDPEYFFIFQMWHIGMDNPRIEFGGPSSVAPLKDFTVTLGSFLEGNLQSLLDSDDNRLRVRSTFGFSVLEPDLSEVRFGFSSSNLQPSSMTLIIESRVDHPNGVVKIRARNWKSNSFQQVGQFNVGFNSDTVSTLEGINPASRIRQSDGRVELAARHVVPAVFSALGFVAGVDQAFLVTNE